MDNQSQAQTNQDYTGAQGGCSNNTQGVCPSCGYCPHCGRRNFSPYPYYQYPYGVSVSGLGGTVTIPDYGNYPYYTTSDGLTGSGINGSLGGIQ